jgi:hypothetical protein
VEITSTATKAQKRCRLLSKNAPHLASKWTSATQERISNDPETPKFQPLYHFSLFHRRILLSKEQDYCRSLMQLERCKVAWYVTDSLTGSVTTLFVADGRCRAFHEPFQVVQRRLGVSCQESTLNSSLYQLASRQASQAALTAWTPLARMLARVIGEPGLFLMVGHARGPGASPLPTSHSRPRQAEGS